MAKFNTSKTVEIENVCAPTIQPEFDYEFGPLPVPLCISQSVDSRWQAIYSRLFSGKNVSVEVELATQYLAERHSKLANGYFAEEFDWKEALRRAQLIHAAGLSALAMETARRERIWENVKSSSRMLLEDGFSLNKSGRDFILASHGAFAFAMLSSLSSSNSLYKFGPLHIGLFLCGIGLFLLIPGTIILIKVNIESAMFLQDQYESRPAWRRFDRERKVYFGRKRVLLNWANFCIYGSLGVLAMNAIAMSMSLMVLSITT